jgi:hypothetical protein
MQLAQFFEKKVFFCSVDRLLLIQPNTPLRQNG